MLIYGNFIQEQVGKILNIKKRSWKMTNIEYLRNRMTELEKEGRLTEVFHRFCMESDVEGLRKIIKENINISCIKVIPKIHPFYPL
jgi:hypothetical protein